MVNQMDDKRDREFWLTAMLALFRLPSRKRSTAMEKARSLGLSFFDGGADEKNKEQRTMANYSEKGRIYGLFSLFLMAPSDFVSMAFRGKAPKLHHHALRKIHTFGAGFFRMSLRMASHHQTRTI